METPSKGFDTNYGVPIKIKTAIIYYGIPIIIGCTLSLSCTFAAVLPGAGGSAEGLGSVNLLR